MNNKDNIYDLCIDIIAHANLDWEVTIGGNGTNPCEARNVAEVILKLMEVDKESILIDVANRMNELEIRENNEI